MKARLRSWGSAMVENAGFQPKLDVQREILPDDFTCVKGA